MRKPSVNMMALMLEKIGLKKRKHKVLQLQQKLQRKQLDRLTLENQMMS